MALFQGMNIGTAKPSADDRSRVPHHLLDLLPPTEEFSLSEYIDAAHAAIADIKSRGREVLFVGGTPLYLKSLLRGVYQGPPADWNFRHEIERELEKVPLAALHERLQVIDPLLAARLHPNDKRRIVRGLEVYRLTGQRLSHLQTQFDEGRPASAVKVFVLSWPRDELHHRIDARVEQMFAAGLVEEVRGLLSQYGSLSRTAMQAVGYREVIEYLSTQDSVPSTTLAAATPHSAFRTPQLTEPSSPPPDPLAPCLDLVKARTRQFARRQETWFRALTECTPVPMRDDLQPPHVAQAIIDLADSRKLEAHNSGPV
jgi:tRNA dimethylallyltransferase